MDEFANHHAQLAQVLVGSRQAIESRLQVLLVVRGLHHFLEKQGVAENKYCIVVAATIVIQLVKNLLDGPVGNHFGLRPSQKYEAILFRRQVDERSSVPRLQRYSYLKVSQIGIEVSEKHLGAVKLDGCGSLGEDLLDLRAEDVQLRVLLVILGKDVDVQGHLLSVSIEIVAPFDDLVRADAMAVVPGLLLFHEVGPLMILLDLVCIGDLVPGSHVEVATVANSHLSLETQALSFEVSLAKRGFVFMFDHGDQFSWH